MESEIIAPDFLISDTSVMDQVCFHDLVKVISTKCTRMDLEW